MLVPMPIVAPSRTCAPSQIVTPGCDPSARGAFGAGGAAPSGVAPARPNASRNRFVAPSSRAIVSSSGPSRSSPSRRRFSFADRSRRSTDCSSVARGVGLAAVAPRSAVVAASSAWAGYGTMPPSSPPGAAWMSPSSRCAGWIGSCPSASASTAAYAITLRAWGDHPSSAGFPPSGTGPRVVSARRSAWRCAKRHRSAPTNFSTNPSSVVPPRASAPTSRGSPSSSIATSRCRGSTSVSCSAPATCAARPTIRLDASSRRDAAPPLTRAPAGTAAASPAAPAPRWR